MRTQKAGSDVPLLKRGYSLLFKPWGWVVGTGNYVDDLDAMQKGSDEVDTGVGLAKQASITKRAAGSSDQIKASAAELEGLSLRLKEMIAWFKV